MIHISSHTGDPSREIQSKAQSHSRLHTTQRTKIYVFIYIFSKKKMIKMPDEGEIEQKTQV